jgi:hypothetical protein
VSIELLVDRGHPWEWRKCCGHLLHRTDQRIMLNDNDTYDCSCGSPSLMSCASLLVPWESHLQPCWSTFVLVACDLIKEWLNCLIPLFIQLQNFLLGPFSVYFSCPTLFELTLIHNSYWFSRTWSMNVSSEAVMCLYRAALHFVVFHLYHQMTAPSRFSTTKVNAMFLLFLGDWHILRMSFSVGSSVWFGTIFPWLSNGLFSALIPYDDWNKI